jgi:hypothetical protein
MSNHAKTQFKSPGRRKIEGISSMLSVWNQIYIHHSQEISEVDDNYCSMILFLKNRNMCHFPSISISFSEIPGEVHFFKILILYYYHESFTSIMHFV